MPPIPHSYSLPGTRLHAGEYPGAKERHDALAKLRQLLAFGIDTFIDLTEPTEGLLPYEPLFDALPEADGVQRLNFPIPDVSTTSVEGMHRILDAIDGALANGRTVYVHCWGGVGRTGTVVGCWLVREGHAPQEALATVNRHFQSMPPEKVHRHPWGSPETDEQRQFVLRWQDAEKDRERTQPSLVERSKGCLLGGAVGDALGAPVEFMQWSEIRRRFGDAGIQEYAPAYGRIGAITDDTQMTLWTAEGVIRGLTRSHERGAGGPMSVIPRSYLRWLFTQDGRLPTHIEQPDLILGGDHARPGWLLGVKKLHSRRAPGTTCLSALRDPDAHLWERAANDSKGCGGVMRVAPLALVPDATIEERFEEACRAAAVTHGHPTGILASGALVWMLSLLRDELSLEDAVVAAIARVEREASSEETVDALRTVLSLADSGQEPTPSAVESLGGGWTAETALAIGTYAALVAGRDVERAIRLAVNHSGDSDSTGSIAGQIVGIQLGVQGIAERWLEQLELREVIEVLAEDLVKEPFAERDWGERYPGH